MQSVARILGFVISLFALTDSHALEEKLMIVTIPSYNNAAWYKQNLNSVFMQQYDNYHIIYIDDCSPDGTSGLVKKYIEECGMQHRVTVIANQERRGAMCNHYCAIHACPDEAIIVQLDGDDWLAHENVLQKLNEVYADPEVWLTYGQFVWYPENWRGGCTDFPPQVIQNNDFRNYVRSHGWIASQLRTFYAWLFKKINIECFMYQGKFLPMACDVAMILPMLEMCGDRIRFISDILYIYNFSSPINESKVNIELQQRIADYIYAMPKHTPLKQAQMNPS